MKATYGTLLVTVGFVLAGAATALAIGRGEMIAAAVAYASDKTEPVMLLLSGSVLLGLGSVVRRMTI